VKPSITVNGQTYSSVEEMPPEVRRQYQFAMGLLADKDGNGIPDVLEGKDLPVGAESGDAINTNFVARLATTTIKVNGQEYSRWEDVPASIRDAIEKARAAPQGKPTLETIAPPPKRAAIPVRPAPVSGGLRIGLPWLILLILAAILAGFLIALKLRG
jgi:hypothetical protein